jgi:hypothetical protein
VVLQGYEELTTPGYIRTFTISDAPEKIHGLVTSLEKDSVSPTLWQCDKRKTEIKIHRSLLPYVNWPSADVTIEYSNPNVMLLKEDGGFAKDNLIPANKRIYERHGWSQYSLAVWHTLYIQKMDPKDAFGQFVQMYPGKEKDRLHQALKEFTELVDLAEYEELESGLADIY